MNQEERGRFGASCVRGLRDAGRHGHGASEVKVEAAEMGKGWISSNRT